MIRLPAEWEPQQQVIFAFPRRDGDWGEALDRVSHDLINAANQVHHICPVTMVVSDEEHFAHFAGDYRGNILNAPTDDCWVRDSGPITVLEDDHPTLLDFTFNGWGGKFDARNDNLLPRHLHAALYHAHGYRRVETVLEGGSIESDGRGTILTSSKCLLAKGRNNYQNKTEAEDMLRRELGAKRVIWIDHGELVGDDTDAHIDTLVRFIAPDTIAYVGPPSEDDIHFKELVRMRNQIKKLSDEYTLLEVPFASPLHSEIDGHRLPASYANFLICNGTLFVPTYGIETDASAISTLIEQTEYRVVGVDCRAFVEQHGALHCLTMQVPAGTLT